MAPLIVLIVFLGVFPKPVLDRITPSVNRLVVHVDQVTHTPVPADLRRRTAGGRCGRRARSADPARPATTAGGSPVTGLLAASAAPTIHVPHIDYLSILPMLIMLGGALALMLVSSLLRGSWTPGRHVVAATVSVAALVAALSSGTTSPPTVPR